MKALEDDYTKIAMTAEYPTDGMQLFLWVYYMRATDYLVIIRHASFQNILAQQCLSGFLVDNFAK